MIIISKIVKLLFRKSKEENIENKALGAPSSISFVNIFYWNTL